MVATYSDIFPDQTGKTECSKLLLAALINTINRDGSGGEDSGT